VPQPTEVYRKHKQKRILAYSRAIDEAVSRRLPTAAVVFETRSGDVGFVVDKVTLGRFSPSTSVSPANSHSTGCSTFIIIIIIYHPGLVQ
jgi:hypothetical protein